MAEFENCRLLLVDKKISTARDIVGILEAAVRGGFPLMIMAEDIEQEALATMVVNKLRGTLKVCPAPPPHIHARLPSAMSAERYRWACSGSVPQASELLQVVCRGFFLQC